MINLKGIGWININFVSEILENYDGSYLLVMNNYSDTRGIEQITEMQKDAIVDAINQVKGKVTADSGTCFEQRWEVEDD